jgi:hypothetical protein
MQATATIQQLRDYTLKTVPPFDEDYIVASYFVGWQEGFEPIYVEVQIDDSIDISEEDAIDEALEALHGLGRGKQYGEPDFVHWRAY